MQICLSVSSIISQIFDKMCSTLRVVFTHSTKEKYESNIFFENYIYAKSHQNPQTSRTEDRALVSDAV